MKPNLPQNPNKIPKVMQNARIYLFAAVSFIFCLMIATAPSFAKEIDIKDVAAQPLRHIIKRTGTLDFKRTLKVSFKSSGYLSVLNVDEGDLFQANQLLASLDRTELVEQKNATYARLRQAKNDVERIKILLVKNLSSVQDLERVKTLVQTTRAEYKIAYYNLDKAELRSSFSGVVLSRTSELGEFQSPGQEVLEVAALVNNLVVNVALTGKEVSELTIEQKVLITLPNGQQVTAKISKIAVVADSESHLFMVEVLLPVVEFKNGAIAGQFAEVEIEVFTNKHVYQIPIAALVAVNEQGKALLIIQTNEVNNEIQQQSFDVVKLDNHFVYLAANASSKNIQVIIRGWQQLVNKQNKSLN